jgi:hypothetical protein
MDAYVAEIRKLENKFSRLEIHHVIRDNNVGADVLSKLGSDRANIPPGVFVHELHHPSIKTPDPSTIAQGPTEPDREVLMIEVDWRVTFINYIEEHKLPPGVDPKGAEATRILRCSMWQNRLNFSSSSALMIAIQLAITQRTSNGTIHWSVGSPPDTTMVQQDRSRFTSHEGEFTITE